jgi:hypothetical protein
MHSKKYHDKLMVDGIEVLTDKTTNFKLRSDRYYRLL